MTDFIEIYPGALNPDTCASLIQRFGTDAARQPGRVGSGVIPELKHSQDLTITGRPDWQQAEAALNDALFRCLLQYVRRYPYLLIAPLMLQIQDPSTGQPRRITEHDVSSMDDAGLGNLLRACLRPGGINLQHYQADQGGYPYWHCELYPKDASCEPLHRHLLWTLYLNDGFEEGETEFLYQQRKIAPQVGALLIAPTAFTHTHRGNRPKGGDKYIATSWVLFQRAETLFGLPTG
jgi:hypothetical protein